MTSVYERLGVTPTATPAELKTAYHAKLREFPAHTHPTEFKEIRAAYEEIRQGQTGTQPPFFTVRPLELTLDPTALAQVQETTRSQLKVTLEDMIRETF